MISQACGAAGVEAMTILGFVQNLAGQTDNHPVQTSTRKSDVAAVPLLGPVAAWRNQ